MISELGQGKYKMSLGHLVALKRNCSKTNENRKGGKETGKNLKIPLSKSATICATK